MIDKIGFLVRFWELRARHASLGQPLSGAEQLELLSLMQLVTSDATMPQPGAWVRPDDALPAQLIGQGVVLPVEIRSVCASAIVVSAPRAMPVAERVLIRVTDAVSGIELTLPCTVAWVHPASSVITALVVDGVPTRTDFGSSEPRLSAALSGLAAGLAGGLGDVASTQPSSLAS